MQIHICQNSLLLSYKISGDNFCSGVDLDQWEKYSSNYNVIFPKATNTFYNFLLFLCYNHLSIETILPSLLYNGMLKVWYPQFIETQ